MGRLLIINGSPRHSGLNSRIAAMISESIKKLDYETEILNICDMDIGCCSACEHCKKERGCVKKDDMTQIYDKIRESDMMVLASPIYMGAETGPMKTFIDRLYALVRNEDGKEIHDIGKLKKTSVLFTCGAMDGKMRYAPLLKRMCEVMKYIGVEDFGSGTIICDVKPEGAERSEKVKDYIESIEFQIGF